MIILTGKNLGERHRELNIKVKEAAAVNVDFEEIKNTSEKSDVDRLFKIDLASKYMNIDYIIEVLKSGDSLYISRALKCSWIYGDDFANIISVDNLHNNVIPYMSTKMKKKLLTAILVHVRNEKRAAAFYQYCMDIKLTGLALKFINITSDEFKLALLQDKTNRYYLMTVKSEYLKHFIGLSFTLADAYIAMFDEYNRFKVFRPLSYLYTVSDVKFLDLLEKYVVVRFNKFHLGLRISRSIMKKHKNRVLKNPSLYVNILSKSVLCRYSTDEDAKIYAVAVLPDTASTFWCENYCITYKFILDLILDEKFKFIKQMFTTKYPGEEFETSLSFYNMNYYNFMTAEERETWALSHIASGAEILGIGKDYNWYKFVSFDKALQEIKKLVMVTSESTKRADMVSILIESAKTQRDVEKLLKYYYERHINERRNIKENFLDKLISYFNVYQFDGDCWATLEKVFHNLEVYSMTDYFNCKTDYKIIALIYSIINKTDVHEAIKLYIRSNMYFYLLKSNTDKLTKEQQEMVFQYLFEFYMDEIRKSENVPYDDDVKHHLRKYIYFVLDLLDQYNRTKNDCPELVNHFMKLDWAEFKCHRLLQKPATNAVARVDLLRNLKDDAKAVVEHLPLLKKQINSTFICNISTVLKKLKIYFSHDIAKVYLQFFDNLLKESDDIWYMIANAAVHGIFQLGEESFKADFMQKYAPTEPKINHAEINRSLLNIQKAICSQACYSRPPVPLQHILMYIKGDYVHFCLPMFNSYLANLPLPLCMEFIEALLNTPVSIQKHGLRLAFECFNTESLNKLVLRVWKKTKNVSLRMVIFKAIFNKVSDGDRSESPPLFDTLKTITSTIKEDDDDELFSLLVSYKLPEHLRGKFIEVAWKAMQHFRLKAANLNRMRNVIDFINGNIRVMPQEVVHDIVDSFIASVFMRDGEGTENPIVEATNLTEAKWNLTAGYILNVQDKDDLDVKLKLTALILKQCLKPLEDSIRDKKYVVREICFNFINNLEKVSYIQAPDHQENINIIMEFVLKSLQDTLPIEETYMLIWELKLGIAARKIIADFKMNQNQPDKLAVKHMAAKYAKELGSLIKEFVEKGIYYASFINDIHAKITKKIVMVQILFDTRIKFEDVAVAVCVELIQFEIKEIYLLVLHLISSGCSSEYKEDFKAVIKKIKELDDKEIQCNLYKKFVNTDFTVRQFMHS